MVVLFLTVHYKHVQPSPFAEMSLQHVYFCLLGGVLVSLYHFCENCLQNTTDGRKEGMRFYFGPPCKSLRVCGEEGRAAGGRDSCRLLTPYTQSGSSLILKPLFPFHSVQFRTPVHEMVLPMLRMSLLMSINIMENIPPRCVQRLLS